MKLLLNKEKQLVATKYLVQRVLVRSSLLRKIAFDSKEKTTWTVLSERSLKNIILV